ncbi:hypothetical protein HK104_009670, partial [Borealophlyctis nickersoniae]
MTNPENTTASAHLNTLDTDSVISDVESLPGSENVEEDVGGRETEAYGDDGFESDGEENRDTVRDTGIADESNGDSLVEGRGGDEAYGDEDFEIGQDDGGDTREDGAKVEFDVDENTERAGSEGGGAESVGGGGETGYEDDDFEPSNPDSSHVGRDTVAEQEIHKADTPIDDFPSPTATSPPRPASPSPDERSFITPPSLPAKVISHPAHPPPTSKSHPAKSAKPVIPSSRTTAASKASHTPRPPWIPPHHTTTHCKAASKTRDERGRASSMTQRVSHSGVSKPIEVRPPPPRPPWSAPTGRKLHEAEVVRRSHEQAVEHVRKTAEDPPPSRRRAPTLPNRHQQRHHHRQKPATHDGSSSGYGRIDSQVNIPKGVSGFWKKSGSRFISQVGLAAWSMQPIPPSTTKSKASQLPPTHAELAEHAKTRAEAARSRGDVEGE